MSASSSKKVDKAEQEDKALNPIWLEPFLNETFFDSCTTHPFDRNELGKYCINCNLPVCQYCASSGTHCQHKILKVYRLVYKDVVSLVSMEKYIDCSQIQPYKCNKRLVIALKPLPHCGAALRNEVSCNICNRRLAEPNLYHYCSISCKVKAVLRKSDDSVPPFISIQSLPQEKGKEPSEPWKTEKRKEPSEHQKTEKGKEPSEPRNTEKRKEPRKTDKGKEPSEPWKTEKHKEPSATQKIEKQKEPSEPQKRVNGRKGMPHRAPFF